MSDFLYGNGIKQGDLVDLLASIKTKFNTLLVKLDADGGVTDLDYNSTLALSIPDGMTITESKGVRDQGVIVTFLNTIITKFNSLLTKLDADGAGGGISGTNYSSLWAITDVVDGSGLDGIRQIGLFQSCEIKLLDTIITNLAAVNAKLDLDGGVTDTNYAALCNVTDTVDASGTQSRCI